MVVLASDATNFKPRVPQQSSSKPRIIKRFLTLAQAFFGKSICYPDILEIYGNLYGDLYGNLWKSIWKSGNLRFTTQLWTPAIDGLDLFQKWLGSMTTSCILKSRFTESIATTNPTWQRASFQCHAWLPEGNHIQELGVYLTIPFVEEEEAPWSSMI